MTLVEFNMKGQSRKVGLRINLTICQRRIDSKTEELQRFVRNGGYEPKDMPRLIFLYEHDIKFVKDVMVRLPKSRSLWRMWKLAIKAADERWAEFKKRRPND